MITLKDKILDEFGTELKANFSINPDDITNSSVSRFRSADDDICFRAKTLLTFTGKLQKVARKALGSMNYDIITQGQKIDYSTGYQYYITESKELTKAGFRAVQALIHYYENKISFDYIVNAKPITAGDKVIEAICNYVKLVNKGHATNAIKSQYKNNKNIRGAKGRRI